MVIFIVAILISVILHELGHFLTAKKFGMKATQFFVGFGQTLWSTTRGETEYGIKALPFGAFVRITGMTTLDEVDPADEPRSMRNKPAWQRAIVMVAGSFMHFALAFVLLLILAIGIGQANDNTTTIGSVSTCVPGQPQGVRPGIVREQPRRGPRPRRPGSSPATRSSRSPGSRCTTGPSSARPSGPSPQASRWRSPCCATASQLTLYATPATVPGRQGSYLGIGDAVVFQRSRPARRGVVRRARPSARS